MKKYHEEQHRHPKALALRVVDLNKMKRFYTDGMGFRVLKEEQSKVELSVDGTNSFLTLISNPDYVLKPRGRSGLYHFAILLPSRRDLGSFIRHIMSYGAEHVGGSNHGVSEAFYMEDPEKNGIEIYSDLPDDKWDYEGDKPVMYTEPLDYKGLLEESQDTPWQGMPESTILGHIHLHVGDLDKALNFYKILGFNLVHNMAASAYFISTGGYHHHIGFNVWNGRGAPAAPENASGLDSFVMNAAGEELPALSEKIISAGYQAHVEGNRLLTKDPSGNGIAIEA